MLHHVPWLILTFVILFSLSFSTLLSLITYSIHSYCIGRLAFQSL